MKDIPIAPDKLVLQTITEVQEIGRNVRNGTITPNEGLLKTLDATKELAEQDSAHALQLVAFNFLLPLSRRKP